MALPRENSLMDATELVDISQPAVPWASIRFLVKLLIKNSAEKN
jgi:hypothetical protein